MMKLLDLLPFEFLEYDFMKYALLAVLINDDCQQPDGIFFRCAWSFCIYRNGNRCAVRSYGYRDFHDFVCGCFRAFAEYNPA